MTTDTYDYLIAGGGLCGCALASRLAQDVSTPSVALIEAGPDEVNNVHVKAPHLVEALLDVGLVQDIKTVPQKHCNDRPIATHLGRMLAGGSAANYFCWTRPSSTDFDVWADEVNHERWRFKNLVPYMNRAEHWHDPGADPTYTGLDGPVHTTAGHRYPMRDMLKEAFLGNGYKENTSPSNGDRLGFTQWVQNLKVTDGITERQHSAYVYDLSKVIVMANTPVRRVIFQEGAKPLKAKGVELADGRVLMARREVILCAGACRTPQLLMLSGIGGSEQLSRLKIPQLLDHPAVGTNLFDHVALFQMWNLKNPDKGLALGSPNFPIQMQDLIGLPVDWAAFHGLEFQALKDVMLQDGMEVSDDHPHLRSNRAHGFQATTYAPIGLAGGPLDGSKVMTASMLLLPTSRGTITLANDDPNSAVIVDPNFLATKTDRYILREIVRRTMAVMESPALAAEVSGESPTIDRKPLTTSSSDEEIDWAVGEQLRTFYHPMGTAAMGKVVDADLKVMGTENLRIVDASVFPTPLCTMPQSTLYGMAELMAEVILGKA